MNRRQAVAALAGGVLGGILPRDVRAKPGVKRVAIFWVWSDKPSSAEERGEYERRFERHGFRLGDTLEILWFETVLMDPKTPRVEENVRRIFEARPDCIITGTLESVCHLQQVSREIPIVAALGTVDPVEAGLAATLSRPGGNVTGMHDGAYALNLKRLEIMKQLVPNLSGVGWIAFRPQLSWFPLYERAARELGLRVRKIIPEVAEKPKFERVQAEVARLPAEGYRAAHFYSSIPTLIDAVTAGARASSLVLSHDGERISNEAAFAFNAVFNAPGYDNQARLAAIASRILRGEKPGEIPFEGPVGYRLRLNRTLAARLGLTIPPALLLQADEIT